MVIGLLGNKIGMTQIFDKDGSVIPVSLLKVGPCVVIGINLYNKSIQIGYKPILDKKLTKPVLGKFKKINIKPLKYIKEFQVKDPNIFKIGQILNLNIFESEKNITIKGKTIGKGFTGLQKRHNFVRGPKTHGSKNYRKPGSIGMGTTPGRVFPYKKMSGQLGNKVITIKNLKIVKLDIKENILIVKGSIPGKNNNLLVITPSLKKNNYDI
uniref:Large ribosomal subunit protein uL3c n=1 Tax=Nitzschia sp. PL3-2 TaxID=2083271 RepID=A0A2Z5ZAU2_9STRA|nr:ribosomal protein L3 [Nitzschia sp. PL3-2]